MKGAYIKALNSINRKGQVLIFVSLALVILILFAGLALDSGIGYAVKAKLYAAVDSAALVAGQTLGQGDGAAKKAAERFFKGNFPEGYLRATPSDPVIDIDEPDAEGYRSITVSATAEVPTFFMRIVGQDRLTVHAEAVSKRRNLDMVLVLDSSGSLSGTCEWWSSCDPETFRKLKKAATDFIKNFNEGPDGDRVGLVTFASGAVTDVPIRESERGFNKGSLISAIETLNAEGATASAEAMRRALEQLNAVNENARSSLRVIVFFSDGAPNMVAGNFVGQTTPKTLFSDSLSGPPPNKMCKYDALNECTDIVTPPDILPNHDYRCDGIGYACNKYHFLESYNKIRSLDKNSDLELINTRCNLNKAARNMLENVAYDARRQGIHIFSIGLGRFLNEIEVQFCDTYSAEEYGANLLKRVANTPDQTPVATYNDQRDQPSGLYVYAEDADGLHAAFKAVGIHILRLSR